MNLRFLDKIDRGEGPVPGNGFLMILEVLVNLLRSILARDLKCNIFRTSESAKVVLGSGFNVKVVGAQKSELICDFGAATGEKWDSSKWWFLNLAR